MTSAVLTDSTTDAIRPTLVDVKSGDNIGPFTLTSPVAEGNSGNVWKARNQEGLEVVAIKFIKYSYNGAARKRALRVSRLGKEHAHHGLRFLCLPEQTAIFKGHDCIISQLYAVDVHMLLQTERILPLPIEHCKAITWQILSGLYYLHSIGIVHGDIKPENVLLASMATVQIQTLEDDGLFETKEILQSPEVKIADLDDAKLPRQQSYRPLGTSGYRAPELHLGKSMLPFLDCQRVICSTSTNAGEDVTEKTDIFALGCMAYEIHTAQQLFPVQTTRSSKSEDDEISIVTDPNSKWSNLCDDDTVAFVKRAILENHKRRPQAKSLLKHRYFGELAYIEKD